MALGSSTKTPSPAKKIANLDEDSINTNQEAIPVPVLWGRRRLALQWGISPIYNQVNEKVTGQTGKNSEDVIGYIYYGDIAGLICMGGRQPLDGIYKIIIDGEEAWTGTVVRDASYYETITIPKYGVCRIYWGYPDQPIDTLILGARTDVGGGGFNPRDRSTYPDRTGAGATYNGMLAGDSNPRGGHYDSHPAYRNQAYIAFKKFKIGRDRTQMPNIEVEVQRGTPYFGDTVIAATSAGANFAGILFDALTDDIFGEALPEARLNQASFDTLRDALDDSRISPLLTNTQDFRSFVAQLLEYGDLYARRIGGTLYLGRWSKWEDIVVDDLPVVGSDELAGEPTLTPAGLENTKNEVRVIFTDAAHKYKESVESYNDANNRRLVGEPRPVTLQRPWITSAALAKSYAIEYGKMLALPAITGTVQVKREVARTLGLMRGERFLLNSESNGLGIVCRILEDEWPADKDANVTFTVENERAIGPRPFIQPPATKPPGFIIGVTDIETKRVVELPAVFRILVPFGENAQLAILALRPDAAVLGFRVHVSADGGSTYSQVVENNPFAVFGQVATAYAAAGPIVDTVTGLVVDLFGIDLASVVTQTDVQREDGHLLIFLGNEIMSVGSVTALGDGRFNIKVRRAMYGTQQETHPVAQDAWFLFRDRIFQVAHSSFTPGATRLFKLQPFTDQDEADLGDVTAFSYTLSASLPFRVTGLELEGIGNATVFTGKHAHFAWRLTSTLPVEVGPWAFPPAAFDETFQEYRIRVRDAVTGEIVFASTQATQNFIYTYEQNALSTGGLRRAFKFGVSAVDIDGNQTPWQEISVSNPAPVAPANLVIALIGENAFITADWPADLDAAKRRIWRSAENGFTPSDATLVYDGTDTSIVLPHPSGAVYYYIVADYDAFGDALINYSAQQIAWREGEIVEDLPLPSVAPGTALFTTTITAQPAGAPTGGAESGLYYTEDNSPANLGAVRRWPVVLSLPVVYDSLTFTESVTLRIREFVIPTSPIPASDDPRTHQSPELILHYMSDAPVTGGGGSGGGATAANVAIRKLSGTRGRSACTVSFTCATAASTIYYEIDGGGFGAYTPGSVVAVDLDSILEAYAEATGFNDGPISTFDNTTNGPPL